jgi:hypothetical protein
MSKKNIVHEEKVDNNTHRLTFSNEDGFRIYEFKGSAARAVRRGRDPQGLTGGRLVQHTRDNPHE